MWGKGSGAKACGMEVAGSVAGDTGSDGIGAGGTPFESRGKVGAEDECRHGV